MACILSSPPFYSTYIHPPSDSPSPYLQNNPKFWPFFKGVIGAIDGSHIALSCPAAMHAACCN